MKKWNTKQARQNFYGCCFGKCVDSLPSLPSILSYHSDWLSIFIWLQTINSTLFCRNSESANVVSPVCANLIPPPHLNIPFVNTRWTSISYHFVSRVCVAAYWPVLPRKWDRGQTTTPCKVVEVGNLVSWIVKWRMNWWLVSNSGS